MSTSVSIEEKREKIVKFCSLFVGDWFLDDRNHLCLKISNNKYFDLEAEIFMDNISDDVYVGEIDTVDIAYKRTI